MGGGFADDEPGAKTDEMCDSARNLESSTDAPEPVPDVHTRDSELNDEYLRDVRRTDQEQPVGGPAAASRRRGAD